MPTETSRYGFITGWSKSQYSYAMYYKPFKTSLWTCFLLFITILAVLKTICVDKITTIGEIVISFIGNILYVLAPVLEDSVIIPNRIMQRFGFKLVLILWLLEACVLTNLYSSSLISDLLSPMPTESIQTFEDIILKSENNERFSLFDDTDKQYFSFNEIMKEILRIKKMGKINGFVISKMPNWQKRFDIILNEEHVSPQIKESCFNDKIRYTLALQFLKLVKNDVTIPRKLAISITFLLISEANEYVIKSKYNNIMYIDFVILHLVPFAYQSLLLMRKSSMKYNMQFTSPIVALNYSKYNYKYYDIFWYTKEFKSFGSELYDSLVEEELIKKGEFIHIDTVEKISQEYEYISKSYTKHEQKIFRGDFGDLISNNKAVPFLSTKNSMLAKYFQWFYESGCYFYFIKNNTGFNFGKRRTNTKIIKKLTNMNNIKDGKTLGLSTTFKTFFIIWLITIAFATSFVILEFIRENGFTLIRLGFLFMELFWFKVLSCCKKINSW